MAEVRTQKNAEALVDGISAGKPLRQICRELGISKSAVYVWIEEDAEFGGRIARARKQGYDAIADECLEIADAESEDAVAVSDKKVRIETRLKLLAKWDPKRYGEASLMKLAGPDGEGPVQAALAVTFISTPKVIEDHRGE